jgi:hypothetical protein
VAADRAAKRVKIIVLFHKLMQIEMQFLICNKTMLKEINLPLTRSHNCSFLKVLCTQMPGKKISNPNYSKTKGTER